MNTPRAGGSVGLPRGRAARVPREATARQRLGMQIPARAGWFVP
jgi:hypothetical protein